MIAAREPPRDERELLARAHALEGSPLPSPSSVPSFSSVPSPSGRGLGRGSGRGSARGRTKGALGTLLERALGARGGSFKGPDFPALGVELKTLPIDAQGRARESTFVCSLSLRDAEQHDFEASPLFAKLRKVLWVPIVIGAGQPRIGRALLWQPTPAQRAILRGDYDDLVGMIAIGKIEALDARLGRWLQVRPKAANGRARTRAFNEDGEVLWTMPRGFYLRARFTTALLREPGHCG